MTVLAAGLSAAPLHSKSPFSESPPETEPQSWRERLDSSGGLDDAYWEKVRQEFNIVDGITYMNNGTMGPVPRSVVEAQTRYLIDIAADPRIGGWNRVEPVREKLARFVGANADEIVLTRSTTEGMKIFSRGLDLGRGDEVLMSSHEHPGGYGPWRAREDRDGIIVRTVDIPAPPNSVDEVIDICERALRPETRVLVVSYPIFVTGLLMPIKGLAEMAHRHNVLLSVDGAHALGMLDLDLHDMGCDHFTTAGQKWLLAGSGTGMAYFSNEIQDRVWSDVAWPFPLQGARKYESSGQRHLPSALGMGDALDFQLAIGKTNIQTRVRQLAKRLKDGLRDLPAVGLGTSGSAEMSGGLTTFYIDGVPKANIQQALMDREEIYLPGSGLNDFACRVSTHFYNTADEVDRVIQVIQHIVENRADYARVG
ncbi:MAG TPA: aminotransferase class V-fold PLP-dependent enzyme [Vicinamibacterales bacterium]|jgi:selenocysteine lyase/cysteine desulfurase|nr:aminotransferase class V-fold PLP-dependent enzyme [Vicinamibacterales bacterium]|tara:strand:+ start:22319 stop:23590 length:1272 start_codon:yes stop_codon:yes gene_type:complete